MAKKKNPERQKKFFIAGMVAFGVVATVVYFMRSDGSSPITYSPDSDSEIEHVFVCPDGYEITTQFQDGRVDLRLPDGRLYSLAQRPSAGGARYANSDESMVLWNIGDTVTVEEKGTTIYSECVSQ